MFTNIHVNPSPSSAMATFEGIDLNNQAYQAKLQGDFPEAERLYLSAIDVKERHFGPNAITTALSQNALGEVYLQMGKMEEAEDNLTKALAVRSAGGPPFDAAVTRENLAQLAEMKGQMSQAKALNREALPILSSAPIPIVSRKPSAWARSNTAPIASPYIIALKRARG